MCFALYAPSILLCLTWLCLGFIYLVITYDIVIIIIIITVRHLFTGYFFVVYEILYVKDNLIVKLFKRQPHKIVRHTQTIRRQFADELFECVWRLSEGGTRKINSRWKRYKLEPWHFAAFSNILLDTLVPKLVSITCSSLQILGKTQTGISLIFRFLVNPL